MLQSLVAQSMRLVATPRDTSDDAIYPNHPPADDFVAAAFCDKQVLVVGGTRGIGRGIAVQLVETGRVGRVVVVGRNVTNIVMELRAKVAAVSATDHTKEEDTTRTKSKVTTAVTTTEIVAHAADLFTVAGAQQLVHEIVATQQQRPFDYVFFTAGCWPDYADPWTADGIEKMVALDLVSHHVILKGLYLANLLQNNNNNNNGSCVIVNTVASVQAFPFQSFASVQERLTQAVDGTTRPSRLLPVMLMPVSLAADAWLRAWADRMDRKHHDDGNDDDAKHNLKFIGMFPGLVATNLSSQTFPWLRPLFAAQQWVTSMPPEACGALHLSAAAAVAATTSNNNNNNNATDETQKRRRRSLYYFDHLLIPRQAHAVVAAPPPAAATQDGNNDGTAPASSCSSSFLATWVYDWLEQVIQEKTTSSAARMNDLP